MSISPEASSERYHPSRVGTIFLDEIGELPEDAQDQLLHVLEEGQLDRVGGRNPFPSMCASFTT